MGPLYGKFPILFPYLWDLHPILFFFRVVNHSSIARISSHQLYSDVQGWSYTNQEDILGAVFFEKSLSTVRSLPDYIH